MNEQLSRFIDCYIATETCNLRCHYCYITQRRLFNQKLASFPHSFAMIRRSLAKCRLGGVCLFNLCAGGETLLVQEIIGVIKVLLEEGHYVMVVTNGTLSRRFDEIAALPGKLLHRLFIKFSFHYLELVRLDMLAVFFANIRKMQQAGVSMTVEITPSDELIPHIADVQSVCRNELGALCHVTIARDDRTAEIGILSRFSLDENKQIWQVFQSELFDFKTTIFQQKRREFCYAGEWSLYLNLSTGQLTQCYCGKTLDNIYADPDRPLKLEAIGRHCTLPHCYNGHAFLTLGTIPELVTPTYALMRDRLCADGRHWLGPEIRALFSQKLADHNRQYTRVQKLKLDAGQAGLKLLSRSKKIIKKITGNT